MVKVKITQAESAIGAKQNMKDTLCTLRLRKIGRNVVRESTDTALGAMYAVHHLVIVEEVD